jgi:hypothetical protein
VQQICGEGGNEVVVEEIEFVLVWVAAVLCHINVIRRIFAHDLRSRRRIRIERAWLSFLVDDHGGIREHRERIHGPDREGGADRIRHARCEMRDALPLGPW